jgi:hypothetical protein
MAAVQPEPWLRALITTTTNNNKNNFHIVHELKHLALIPSNLM